MVIAYIILETMSLFGSQGPSKKIVIKVRKCSALKSSEEVRKVVLNAADEPMTLDELCLMCQRIFHLPPSSQVSMKYIDAGLEAVQQARMEMR